MALKQNPLTTDEFRLAHSKIIEEFQWLEWSLKNMYANLIDGHYPECFDEVAEKPLGKLIEKLKDVENRNHTHYLTDEDYDNLRKVRDMRNYWCHSCYVEGDGYLEQLPDMSIVKKSRGLIDRVKKEFEIVRELEKKLGDIKIPEGTDKWRWDDFFKIVGMTYYDGNGNKIFEIKK